MKKLILADDHDLCIRTFLQEITRVDPLGERGGVLHVGAHMGEEVPAYQDAGYKRIHLVEANPEVLPQLSEKFAGIPMIEIIPVAVGESSGTADFVVHKTIKGGMESSGMLALDRLGEIVPVFNSDIHHKVPMVTIDELFVQHGLHRAVDLLVIDIQGAELQALRGAVMALREVVHVICEVNLISNYKGCPLERDIDAFMDAQGFDKILAIYHELYDEKGRFPGWGECLWRRKTARTPVA